MASLFSAPPPATSYNSPTCFKPFYNTNTTTKAEVLLWPAGLERLALAMSVKQMLNIVPDFAISAVFSTAMNEPLHELRSQHVARCELLQGYRVDAGFDMPRWRLLVLV